MSIYVLSHNIVSPLGLSSDSNFKSMIDNQSALAYHNNNDFSDEVFCGSIIPDELIENAVAEIKLTGRFTKFEKICILSIYDAIRRCKSNLEADRTLLILSSTKGNIDYIEKDINRARLWVSAGLINSYFGFKTKPLTISLACISGVAALITAQRILNTGKYDNVVICGADIFSRFVLSGFQSFHAISRNPCKPYDSDRTGISLGEAAGTIILSVNNTENKEDTIEILGGAITNDANHLSGPSIEATGLTDAINISMKESHLVYDDIDFISAHGTATQYNDDMEALAFTKTGLNNKPINSLKGYFGHTLGASGIVESVITIKSMSESTLIKSIGFDNPGTTNPINIIKEHQTSEIKYSLKTASGFGGSNAAIIFARGA